MDYKDKSRFEIYDPEVIEHRGKTLKTVIASRKFNEFYSQLGQDNYQIAILSPVMAGRPDIISQAAYGTPAYWWIIVLANSVNDIDEDLTAGKEIKIPII